MRWAGISVGAVLLFLIAGYSLGIFLPSTYEASSSRDFEASVSEVWSALNDFEQNPISATMARGITALEDVEDQPAWIEDIGSSTLTIRTEKVEKNKLLIRNVRDNIVPLSATIEIRVRQQDGKTIVSMSNATTIREGTWHVPLFRLSLFFTDALETGVSNYLDQIEESTLAAAA
jgi:hypothetical protein